VMTPKLPRHCLFRGVETSAGTALYRALRISAPRADMVALLLAFTGFFIFFNNRESRRALLVMAAALMC